NPLQHPNRRSPKTAVAEPSMRITFDLNTQISQLQQRYNELQGYSPDTKPNAPSLLAQQTQITAWLASINQKLIYLRNILANRAASQVIMDPPTPQEEAE